MTTTPVRLQLSRRAGFNMQAHSRHTNGLAGARVDRQTAYGNPFRQYVLGGFDERQAKRWGWCIANPPYITDNAAAVRAFKHHLTASPACVRQVQSALKGKNLFCWCAAGEPCHADVLIEVANR